MLLWFLFAFSFILLICIYSKFKNERENLEEKQIGFIFPTSLFPHIANLRKKWKVFAKETENITRFRDDVQRPQEIWVDNEEEFKKFVKSNIHTNNQWIAAWDHGGKWYNYPIILNDEIVDEETTRKLCPQTVKALSSLKKIKIAGFSRLNAGGEIHPHDDGHGPQKKLVYHLGLVGSSHLSTAGKVLTQSPGIDFVFDSEYEHAAKNEQDIDRIVLYVLFDKEHHMIS